MRRSGVRSSSSPPGSKGSDTLRAFFLSGTTPTNTQAFSPTCERRRAPVRPDFRAVSAPLRSPFSVLRKAPFARPLVNPRGCEAEHEGSIGERGRQDGNAGTRRIDHCVVHHNIIRTPFVWIATADSIFGKLEGRCARISGTADYSVSYAISRQVSPLQ